MNVLTSDASFGLDLDRTLNAVEGIPALHHKLEHLILHNNKESALILNWKRLVSGRITEYVIKYRGSRYSVGLNYPRLDIVLPSRTGTSL